MPKIKLCIADVYDVVNDYCDKLHKKDILDQEVNSFVNKVLNRLKYNEGYKNLSIDETSHMNCIMYKNNKKQLNDLIREATLLDLVIIIRVLNIYMDETNPIELTFENFEIAKKELSDLLDERKIEKKYIEDAIRNYEKCEFKNSIAEIGKSLENILRSLFNCDEMLGPLLTKLKKKNEECAFIDERELDILSKIKNDRNEASHGAREYTTFDEADVRNYLSCIMDIYIKIIKGF